MADSPSKSSCDHWPQGTLENIVIKARSGELFWTRFLIKKFGVNQTAQLIGICQRDLKEKVEPPKDPSLLQQGISFASAGIGFALSGFKLVEQEVKDQRMALCVVCEKFNPDNKTCRVCKCYMELKTWLPKMKCPIGKW